MLRFASSLAAPALRTKALRSALRKPMSTIPESYTDKMNKTGRPVSPHVWPTFLYDASRGEMGGGFIYKLPAIAWSSITMRITGIVATFAASGIGIAATLDPEAPSRFASSLGSGSVGPAAKFVFGFTAVWHYLGACRHIYWDKTAKGFQNASMMQSSYALLGATTVIALGLSMYSLPDKKEKH